MLDDLLAKLNGLDADQRGRTIMRLAATLDREWDAIVRESAGSIATNEPRFLAWDHVREAVYDTSEWYRPHRHGVEKPNALERQETRNHVARLTEELIGVLATFGQ